jgi:dual specificity tyrosine-phosphorylation-regulated kinase 2/3/4
MNTDLQGMKLSLIKSCASQLVQSLRFLDKLHVIHSDLKPENILLEQPQSSKIVVIDFGSSCFTHERSVFLKSAQTLVNS